LQPPQRLLRLLPLQEPSAGRTGHLQWAAVMLKPCGARVSTKHLLKLQRRLQRKGGALAPAPTPTPTPTPSPNCNANSSLNPRRQAQAQAQTQP
jgi:hypothetical protein